MIQSKAPGIVSAAFWLLSALPVVSAVAQQAPALPDAPVKAGSVVSVKTNAEFASAVAAAGPGTTIVLDSASKFSGLVVPDGRSGLLVRPSGDSVTVESVGSGGAALAVGLGCSDLSFERLRFVSTNNGTDSILYTLVRCGYDAAGRREAAKVEELPLRVEFRDCLFEGTPKGNNRIGLLGNARHLSVVGCRFTEFHEIGADSQGILLTNTPGPVLIERCQVSAAGENIMAGGSVATIPGLQIADLTVRDCYLWKPLEWRSASPAWQVKNLLELKGCERCLISGCRLENSWEAAQSGYAFLFTPRDRSRVADVVVENCTISNVGAGAAVSAADDLVPVDKVTGTILFRNNVWLGVGDLPGAGRVWNISSPDGRPAARVRIEGDRWFHGPAGRSVVYFEGKAPVVAQLEIVGTTGTHAAYGVIGSGSGIGEPSLKAWSQSFSLSGNVWLNCPQAPPAGVLNRKVP